MQVKYQLHEKGLLPLGYLLKDLVFTFYFWNSIASLLLFVLCFFLIVGHQIFQLIFKTIQIYLRNYLITLKGAPKFDPLFPAKYLFKVAIRQM